MYQLTRYFKSIKLFLRVFGGTGSSERKSQIMTQSHNIFIITKHINLLDFSNPKILEHFTKNINKHFYTIHINLQLFFGIKLVKYYLIINKKFCITKIGCFSNTKNKFCVTKTTKTTNLTHFRMTQCLWMPFPLRSFSASTRRFVQELTLMNFTVQCELNLILS